MLKKIKQDNMLHSDAKENNLFTNIGSLNPDIILEFQKDLDPYDLISLVFLLYDIPDTSLQRLTVYERICNDVDGDNMNLIYDWSLYAQTRATWKYEFLEALTICRQYHIIRKLGFNVTNLKNHYLPENIHVNMHINPIKKILYKLCECISSENFRKLKDTLDSYEIKVSDHQKCELLFLELMCQKFITVPPYDVQKCVYLQMCEIKDFAKIIGCFSNLKTYSEILIDMENEINSKICNTTTIKSKKDGEESCLQNNENVNEYFQPFHDLQLEIHSFEDLKSDTKSLKNDTYPIKNKKRIGVCCIINQEYFHLSRKDIESGLAQQNLSNRHGSSRDLRYLQSTMASFNFEVISKSNLDHKETILFIKNMIKHYVKTDDSIFMLCILSHGVRGHIFAADSVKIKVQDIQNILDSDEAENLQGIPKVMILQACQVEDEVPSQKIALVADGPNSNFYIKKSHFLIYWATAPEYEAYRHEQGGSLFIQYLCKALKDFGNTEQLSDIFTNVTSRVSTACTQLQIRQLPIFKSTLMKKLYLHCTE